MKNLIQQLHKSMHNMHFSAMQNTRFSNVLTPSVLFLFLLLFGVGNVWGRTYNVGDKIYYDFRAVSGSGGGNYWTNSELKYDAEAGGKYITYEVTSKVTPTTSWVMLKSAKGDWTEIKWKEPSNDEQVRLRVWDDGKGFSWGYNNNLVSGGYIYFDNSVSNFTGTLYFVIGHDHDVWGDNSIYSVAYKMTPLTGTSLYYVNVSADWPDAEYYAVIASSTSVSGTSWGTSNLATKGNNGYTAPYKTRYDLNSGSSYLITTTSAGNNQAMTITYYSGYASLPKVNATQSAKKRDTGTTYSTVSGSWPATLKLQGTQLSDNGATGRTTITSTTSSDEAAKKTYGAVKTGLITHTYTGLSDSYYFEGWGTGSTPSYTSSPYDYNITAATTVYAFFSKKYTLTYDVKSTAGTSTLSVTEVSDFSGTTASGSSIPTGHSITLTATPATGYQLTSTQAWYSNAECTSSLDNGTNTTYTISSLDDDREVYAKFEAISYTITYNLNDGTNHEDNPTSYNIETATIMLQTPTYPGHTFIGWYDNSACTGDAVTSIPRGSTGDKVYWAKWEENRYHFTAKSGNNWSTTDNWSARVLPTINDIVYIDAPVVVDIPNARAKQVIIDQTSLKTGKITINAGKELVVATTLTKTTDGSNSLTTAPEDLVFLSDASHGLGALVTGTLSANQATVNFYTKSHGTSGSSASVAQYLGTPFTDATVLSNFYNSWVYEAIASKGVGNIMWDRLNGSDALKPFRGYCVISADAAGHTYEMQGTLVNSPTIQSRKWSSTEAGLWPNNENLLANSWMAPIKIKAFHTEDFIESYATIYIFNSGSKDDYGDSGEISKGDGPAQYSTYTVKTAEAEEVIIPAMQSFSVFSSGSTGTDGYVNLDYTRLVYNPALAGTVPGPNKAPRRTNTIADEAGKMYVYVSGESGYRDRVYLWQHEDFTDGFENGWDGHKLFGESIAPQLYAQTPDGKMAVNCAPEFDGTILGFTKGSLDNTYTFRFAPQTDEVLYLNDMRTQTSTLINAENTYTFTAGEDDAARFLISRTPYPKMPTGVSDTQASSSKARKIFINGQLYVLNGNALFDITGKRVNVQ
ncbi:MAG: InlB B-repeat-containing protein [Paludibacteraceae bacterium]|nr:InlB B-repeat-containing protein [Paludibacteraceae bacterium]